MDVAESVLEVARQGAPENVRFEVADVASLPFAADSFEAVVCFEVIEHVDDRNRRARRAAARAGAGRAADHLLAQP